MSVTAIIEHLRGALPEMAQVVEAGGDNTLPNVDTSKLILSLIRQQVPDTQIFRVDDNPDDINCELNLVSSRPLELDRHRITQTDVYVAKVRAQDRDDSFASVARIKQAVDEASYATEITDWLQDYDADAKSFRQNLEISFTVPASSPTAELPALLVYELDTKAERSDTLNHVRQRVTVTYGLVLMTNQPNFSELKQSILSSLVGWIASANHTPLQLKQGDPLETEGGLKLYRLVLEHQYHINGM